MRFRTGAGAENPAKRGMRALTLFIVLILLLAGCADNSPTKPAESVSEPEPVTQNTVPDDAPAGPEGTLDILGRDGAKIGAIGKGGCHGR